MHDNDSFVSFMAKCWRMQQELDDVTVDQLIPQLALPNSIPEGKFVGTHSCFLDEYPAIANPTVATPNQMITNEKSHMDRLNGGPPLPPLIPSIPSIQHVGETPTPALSSSPAPCGDPPSDVIKKGFENKESCPGCHYNEPNNDGPEKHKYHLEKGYHVLA